MRFRTIFIPCLTVAAIAVMMIVIFSGCHALKVVSHETKDSVTLKVHDTTVYKYVNITHDSTVIKDSAIGIAGQNAGFSLPYNSTTDTVVKKGSLRITRTVNNGIETINCNSDSLTILIEDLRVIVRQKSVENDTLKTKVSDLNKSHSEVTVKEQSKGWFGRIWSYIKNGFAIIGLVWLVVFIVRKFVKI